MDPFYSIPSRSAQCSSPLKVLGVGGSRDLHTADKDHTDNSYHLPNCDYPNVVGLQFSSAPTVSYADNSWWELQIRKAWKTTSCLPYPRSRRMLRITMQGTAKHFRVLSAPTAHFNETPFSSLCLAV